MTLRTRPSTRSRRSTARQQRSVTRRPAGTLVDHRDELRSRTAVPKSPSKFRPATQPVPARRFGHSPVTKPEHSFGRRLGSKQITSYRGRRVVHEKADTNTVRFVVLLSVFLAVGVAISVWLSGIATQQSFDLNRLAQQDTTLSRELETANRNLEELRSGAEIARHAQSTGAVVATEPGILTTDEAGAVIEQRPANPAESRPLTDVNDAPVRSSRASSSPEGTDEITDSVVQVPQETNKPLLRSNAGLAPYDPNQR
ncbi:hypothetical protein ACU6QD_01835 [Corynebacterium glucuronolyticum]